MNMEFDKHINEYMVYCHSRQLRPKTMHSYESTLRLFEKWCRDEMGIEDVDKIAFLESLMQKVIYIIPQFFLCFHLHVSHYSIAPFQ